MFPSPFSMKFHKLIRQKRLEDVRQIGMDRVVDLRFGNEDRACHVIIELYNRGSVLLTDHNYTILNILRPRTDKDYDVKFTVRGRYPLELGQYDKRIPDGERAHSLVHGQAKQHFFWLQRVHWISEMAFF
uniref:FHA domain-containing protein n=1 Tax=Strongyloides papillosus TaxID=174720 RepID=A0A0N5C160_STREA